MRDKAKLEEIQTLASDYNRKLMLEFSNSSILAKGGNLFLGANYAASGKIFITFNPGLSKNNTSKFEVGLSPYNRYWDSYYDKDYLFWKNSRKFFQSQPLLRTWINDATSAFLIPWRTKNITSFNSEPKLKERICEYSGTLIRKMVEHHHANTLIVSGVATLNCLSSNAFLNFDTKQSQKSKGLDLGLNYQCKVFYPDSIRSLVIFQVPHFSRANSKEFLPACSSWLWGEIAKMKC